MPAGRPKAYSKELAEKVLDSLREGTSLDRTCRQEGFPAKSTVYIWIKEVPEFSNEYAQARDQGYTNRADKLLDLCEEVEDVQRARLLADTHKWILCKMLPKLYGDNLNVEHSGSISVNINLGGNDSTDSED